jgi:hypothetical protein
LPVIASDIFSYRKLARLTGIEEFLCKEKEDWARGIEVLGIKERRLEYLEKSQQILLQHYCMEAVVRQWTEAFDELLSLGAKHGSRQQILKDQFAKPKRFPLTSNSKINLGCGNEYLSGYLNVDIGSELADLRVDILDLDIEKESVDEVLMVHVIEHIDYLQVRPFLDRIRSWLKMDGKLIMEFPDVKKVAHCILEIGDNPEELQRSAFGIRGFYGEPIKNMTVHDYHKWGWSETTMAALLGDLGFSRIDAERPQHHGSRDKRDTRLVAVK